MTRSARRHTGKIFGIGLGKTGTHSLTRALQMLGYRTLHYPDPALMLAGRFDEALLGYDGATDISAGAFFRELDAAYPGSRFVLTMRDPGSWIESMADHRARRAHEDVSRCPKADVRERVFGTRGFDRDLFLRGLADHEARVRAHFAERPGDLLVIDLCGRPAWDGLCAFLGVPVPTEEFPHVNARKPAAA